jgi:hypothetical protein
MSRLQYNFVFFVIWEAYNFQAQLMLIFSRYDYKRKSLLRRDAV